MILLSQIPVPNLDPDKTGSILTALSIILVFIANIMIQREANKRSNTTGEGSKYNSDLVDVTKRKVELENEISRLKEDNALLVSQSKSRPIVYVDDNPDDTDLLRRSFKKWGMSNPVVWFSSSEEAIVYLSTTAVMMAIVDVKMVSNGYRFLDVLKSNPETRDIPITFLTGSVPEDISMYRQGVMCYQQKPLSLSAFLECLTIHGFTWEIRE